VTAPSVPTVTEMVDVALRSYFLIPSTEPKLTNPDAVQEAIRGLNISKAPGLNGIPNRALKHLPQQAVKPTSPRFSMRFTAPITSLQCGSTLVISILPGKDPALL